MSSDPRGPVYLTFPRETLTELWSESAIRSYPGERFGPVAASGADAATIDVLATRLLTAEKPLLITAYSGRNHATPAILDRLARFAGIRVVEFSPLHMNMPQDSPCHGGFTAGKHVAEADVGLLVDVDVPWIPQDTPDDPRTWWAHVDIDAEKRAMPMWTFPGNLRIQGDSHRVLSDLLVALEARADAGFRERAAKRVAALAEEQAARRKQAATLAADHGTPGQINPHFLCAAVARALKPEDIILNEAIRNGPVVFQQVPRTQPGTVVGLAGGGLGFSGGMALGLKLAMPERTVVQFVGDGTFYFSNPQSTASVASQYGLPVFTVVLDNAGWGAVKAATLRVYPEGEAKTEGEFGAALSPHMNFAKVAEASGAHGELISDPAEVEAAIARCLDAVHNGRSALLHAKVTKI
jgi:acetolactate synthase-1/2/3 large subunit